MSTAEDQATGVTLERRLAQRLHAFSNMVQGSYFQRTEKPFGIALAEWRVLRSALLSPGVSQSEIASAEGLNVMNVSRAVAGLRRKGLLEVQPDPADRRRSLLTPTDIGRELGVDVSAREHVMYEHVFSGLSRDELAELNELMDRVNGLLRDGELPDPPVASQPWAAVIKANPVED